MNPENSSNQNQFTTALKYYETIKNYVTTFVSNFLSNNSNQLYVRLGVALVTIMSFLLRFVTTTLLNYAFFLNNLVDTVRNSFADQNDSNTLTEKSQLLNSWTTFSFVMLVSTSLDCVSSYLNMGLVTFVFEVLKCVMYLKLLSDHTLVNKLNDGLVTIYSNNKWTIDSAQNYGKTVTGLLTDAFSEQTKNDLMVMVTKEKNM